MFGNMGAEIPTYARSDNSDALYQVDAVNTMTNEKRVTGFLESNGEEVDRNSRLGVRYIPGDINTSDGITKSLSSPKLKNLLTKIRPE